MHGDADSLSSLVQRFEGEGKVFTDDARVGFDLASAIVNDAIDLDRFHCAAKKVVPLAVEDDVAVPVAADDVILQFGAEDARFGHE